MFSSTLATLPWKLAMCLTNEGPSMQRPLVHNVFGLLAISAIVWATQQPAAGRILPAQRSATDVV